MLIMTDIVSNVRKWYDARKILTFFMCMDRSNVSFQMLATAETLSAIFHLANINTSLTTLSCFSFRRVVDRGGNAATTTLFCQVRDRNRGGCAYSRSTTFGSKRRRGSVQESILARHGRASGLKWGCGFLWLRAILNNSRGG